MQAKKLRICGAALVAALWLGLAVWLWCGSRTDISGTERRKLAQFPELDTQTLLDGRFMTGFESFTQDQFPLREEFRKLKGVFGSYVLQKKDSNGVYLAEGYAAKLEYPLKENALTGAVQKFQKIYDSCLVNCDGKILFSVVPDKGYYLAERNGYPVMDYARLFSAIQDIPWAEYVDLTDCLEADCYYRTDTHWRQETLLPAAQKLADALGVEIEDDYIPTVVERPFYGVYYGQAALPMQPDTIWYLQSSTLSGCTVTNEAGERSAVYDLTKLDSRDLYDVFLSGAAPLLTIENPAAGTDRELIIFRDSFGSSIAPLLVPGYARITLLDTRYLPADYLTRYVDFGKQDVLLLYSPLILNNSAVLR